VNFERLRWGDWIAAIAAADLLFVTFRSWYKVTGGGRVTAWDALEQGRYLLIATAVVGIFLLLMRAAEDTQQLSFPPGWIAAAVGLACTVYAAYRIVTPPADSLDPDIAAFMGLVAALGVMIGGLLSARESDAVGAYGAPATTPDASDRMSGPDAPTPVAPAASTSGWSPAPPAPASSGWSPATPAAPAAPVPPATAAGGAGSGLRSGDSVVLTAGGARFPAGTVARVVEVFAGGALVEVMAPDGMAERFEVPESAYEPAPASATAPAGGSWSPAMPASSSGQDWGFDESAAGAAAAGTAAGVAAPDAADEPKPAKTPWWKREIGGGKKKDDDGAALGAAGAVAAGAAAAEAGTNGTGEEKPGFFKRLFGGGGSKDEPDTETIEAETPPASDVAGVGQAAESDTAVDEPMTESAVDDAPAASEPPRSEPDPLGSEFAPSEAAPAEPDVVVSDPEPPAADPEPEPPMPDPGPAASEPDVVVSDPDPIAPEPPAPEPDVAGSAPDPEVAASAPEPEVAPSAPDPAASAPDAPSGAEAAGAGAAAAAAASAGGDEEQPKPKRKGSSGSRKVPKEAVAAGIDAPPKVGDEVQLKVGGGRFGAGTKGTVVDVFSAGVIVELSDDSGRSERLDLPFEAIGPADA
jgi:hypothetical protein